MTAVMAYRGPDDCGIYVDGEVCLGHRRLSIIDPSAAGHQPMESDDGQFVITFYGEIYNRALRVIYDGPYKLITSSRGERLLFDLAKDPDENDDLAARDAERVAKMETELESAMSSMDQKVAAAFDPYADLHDDIE